MPQFNSILKTFLNYGMSVGEGVFLLILIIMLRISKQIILLLGCGNCYLLLVSYLLCVLSYLLIMNILK